jgi:LytR cell envelope-related transcriptional attenuator
MPAPSEPAPRSRVQALLAVAAVLVVVGGSVASSVLGPGPLSKMFRSTGSAGAAAPAPSPLPVFHGPSHLVVLAIRAEPDPFVALIGSRGERPPLAVDVPAQTVLTMPGSGSGTVSDAAAGDLSTLSISIANTLGTLTEHGAILSVDGLARAVDTAHGVSVSLISVETLGGRNVGPGTVRLSGQQVLDYLSINRAFDRGDRWRAVLRGLLAQGVTLRNDEVTSTDNLSAMNQAIVAARGAFTRELPTKESEGGLLVPQNDPIRNMLSAAFGIHVPEPIPVVVLNGSGAPGVGAKVARKLVPGGFQVVASQNARKFNYRTTTVYANTQDSFPAAERAGRLLGVGAVTLGRSPVSGLADITIVVGKDF